MIPVHEAQAAVAAVLGVIEQEIMRSGLDDAEKTSITKHLKGAHSFKAPQATITRMRHLR